jgi:hypothetical protein
MVQKGFKGLTEASFRRGVLPTPAQIEYIILIAPIYTQINHLPVHIKCNARETAT